MDPTNMTESQFDAFFQITRIEQRERLGETDSQLTRIDSKITRIDSQITRLNDGVEEEDDEVMTYIEEYLEDEEELEPTMEEPQSLELYPEPVRLSSWNILQTLIECVHVVNGGRVPGKLTSEEVSTYMALILNKMSKEALTGDEFSFLRYCYLELCTQPVIIQGETNLYKWLQLTGGSFKSITIGPRFVQGTVRLRAMEILGHQHSAAGDDRNTVALSLTIGE